MHEKKLVTAGKNLNEAGKALIMIHGRGGTAADILSLATHLNIEDFALLAPEATSYSWYPESFLAAQEANEPYLSSALTVIQQVVDEITRSGIGVDKIYFLGFSQGACLTLEYVTRNARRWGGVVAFTGGLIGKKIEKENYKGDFAGTPVFVGSSDPDPHVPVERVYDSVKVLKELGAHVTEKVYPNMGHTITQDEIDTAKRVVFQT